MLETRRQDVTVFEDRPIILPATLTAASMYFAVSLALNAGALLIGDKEAIGMLLGTVLCAFGAVLLFRRDRFAFDATNRRLRWRKWSLAKASSGEIAFDDIIDVAMESMNTSDGRGTYRVALRTPDGSIPLTETYSGHVDDWRELAGRIRTIVGLAGERAADGDTDALLAQGRKIDAIRQLRETEGLDMTPARARVEAFARRTD